MSKDIEALPTLLQKARETTVNDLRSLLSQFDLTEQQWRVIRSISQHGELNAQDLAHESAILGPSLSRILSRLETDGVLNKRVSKNDQRELNISLAAKGKRLYKKVETKVTALYAKFSKNISDTKLRQLRGLLEDVAAIAQ